MKKTPKKIAKFLAFTEKVSEFLNKLTKILAFVLIFTTIASLFFFIIPEPKRASAAISLIQKAKNTSLTNSISATWDSATVAGNFLVAVVVGVNAGSAPTITAPSGWTQADTITYPGFSRTSIYYKENAASETTTGNFTTDAGSSMSLIVAEYSGIATSSSLDKTATNSGSSSSPSTGTTATTTQADELLIGGLGTPSNITYSLPTNSFTIQDSQSFSPSNSFLDRIVSATGTYNTGATQSAAAAWGGVIATFKAATVVSSGGGGKGGVPTGGSSDTGIKVEVTAQGGDDSFYFAVSGSSFGNFTVTTQGGFGFYEQNGLAPGPYSVIEQLPAGWTKTQDNCSNITVVQSQITTCQIENTKVDLEPSITSINPSSAGINSQGFTLEVTGGNFLSSSVVRWEESNRPTAYVSSTKITAQIPSSDLQLSGLKGITVINPSPINTTSNFVNFTVVSNPKPTIDSISPKDITIGSGSFTLKVDGSNFIESSVVRLQNLDLITKYISSLKLEAIVPASELTSVGDKEIVVNNPDPGGGVSNTILLSVNPSDTAKLVIVKNAEGGDETFSYTVTGPTSFGATITTTNGKGQVSKVVKAGTNYFIEETVLNNWDFVTASCSQSYQSSKTGVTNIFVGQEGTTTCTFLNTKSAKESEVIIENDKEPVEGDQGSAENGREEDKGISVIVREISKIIEIPIVSLVTKVASVIGVVAGAVATFSAIATSIPSFSELFWNAIRLIGALATAFGLKKRIKHWGTVYDSVTKQPLDPAYVILRDSMGKEIASSITDLDGRYGFLAGPGIYKITAQKTNYSFPSKELAGATQDEIYSNLYFGGQIEVKKFGDVIAKNIPLDPLKFDWNEFAKRDKALMNFYSRWDFKLRRFYDLIFVVGFAVAIVAYFFAPRPFNTIILVVYLVLLLLRVLGLKPKSFGYVVQKETKKPLSFAIIRIIMPNSETQIAQKVADKYGRYYCLVPRGKYYVKIEKKNDNGSYSLVYTSPVINTSKRGIIKSKFRV